MRKIDRQNRAIAGLRSGGFGAVNIHARLKGGKKQGRSRRPFITMVKAGAGEGGSGRQQAERQDLKAVDPSRRTALSGFAPLFCCSLPCATNMW
jgi:hypothetical protein